MARPCAERPRCRDWLRRAAEMARPVPAAPAAPTPQPGWPCLPRVAMRTPGTEPGAISAARKFTTLTMERWGLAGRGADVAVVVSELLSNAVRHGLPPRPGSPVTGRSGWACCTRARASCAPWPTRATSPPVPREPDWLDEGGRGLHVIASLSDGGAPAWTPGQAGKVVWAAFRTAP